MLCPKCYAKIKKDKKRCDNCGFNLNELNGASNKQAKKAMKSIYRDDVLFTSQLPEDVSKKKLLLFSIFLGLFGAHHFYVGRIWRGMVNVLCVAITFVLGFLLLEFNIIVNSHPIYIAFQCFLFLQGLNVVFWVKDIVDIICGRYKVPVYKENFSK